MWNEYQTYLKPKNWISRESGLSSRKTKTNCCLFRKQAEQAVDAIQRKGGQILTFLKDFKHFIDNEQSESMLSPKLQMTERKNINDINEFKMNEWMHCNDKSDLWFAMMIAAFWRFCARCCLWNRKGNIHQLDQTNLNIRILFCWKKLKFLYFEILILN